jgi:5'-nucleotidase
MAPRPLVLLSNDDGFRAPGLLQMRQALAEVADVVVCAPHSEQSASSHSISLAVPLRLREHEPGLFSVDGTPADSVYVALSSHGRVLPRRPDIVVSGINLGANMGDDTIYSGTVAAATEGYLLGIPAIAISLTSKAGKHFETAAGVVHELVARFKKKSNRAPWLLNVNVPDLPRDALTGTEVTRLGKRHKAEPVIKATSPRGETIYWIGAAGPAADSGAGTDFAAVAANRVSVTPLQIDLTHYDEQAAVHSWLKS